MEQIRNCLRREGFFTYSRTENDRLSVREIADSLGCSVAQYSFLKPRISSGGRNTLSDAYGLEEFPPHTDGAHLTIPPDYLIMSGSITRKAPTLLWPSHEILKPLGEDAINADFSVNRGGRTFGARFCTLVSGNIRLRFNYDTMKPKNESAAIVHSWLRQPCIQPIVINWDTTSLLVVDNRTILHGRGRSDEGDHGFLRRWTLRKL